MKKERKQPAPPVLLDGNGCRLFVLNIHNGVPCAYFLNQNGKPMLLPVEATSGV